MIASNEEILEKAIQKAIEGGWSYRGYDWRIQKDFHGNLYMQGLTSDGVEVYDLEQLSVNDIIFNHDFAKALWGNPRINPKPLSVTRDEVNLSTEPGWKYHLQQMVIADDPIQYLGANL